MEDTDYYLYHENCGKHEYKLSGSGKNVPPFSLFENIARVLRDIDILGRNDVVATVIQWTCRCNRSGEFRFHEPSEDQLKKIGADKDPSMVFKASRTSICIFIKGYLVSKDESNERQPYMEEATKCLSKMLSSDSYQDMLSHISPMIDYLQELENKKVSGTS